MSLVKIGCIKYVNDDVLRNANVDLHRYVEEVMTKEMIKKAMEEHLPVVADSPTITWWDMHDPEHLEEWYPKEHYPDGPPAFVLYCRWIVEGRWMADTTRSHLKTISIANAYGMGRRQRPV